MTRLPDTRRAKGTRAREPGRLLGRARELRRGTRSADGPYGISSGHAGKPRVAHAEAQVVS